jgi:hypothetical protein
LGTTIKKSQKTMPNGLVAVTTISSMDFPCLFAQPGLVSPDHQGQVMVILQNYETKISQLPDFQPLDTLKM